MSRLLNFICEVLEYFGVSSDKLLLVWQNKRYGKSRSIVRRIGSALPLNRWPRICFQLLDEQGVSHHKHVVPSLADVAWIADDEGDIFTRFRNEVHPAKVQCMISSMQGHYKSTTSISQLKGKNPTSNHDVSNENALDKISQLEHELSHLRSQIAMIISKQDSRPGSACLTQLELNGFCIPDTPAFIPPPKLASTPFSALNHPSMTATEPVLLPPPPPPPPPPNAESKVIATKELNPECQALKINSSPMTVKPKLIEKSSKPFRMMDVLKDLQNVKLRVVERSPGGTPMGRKPATKASISDPAALIADALKRKFAHSYLNDSSDKENESFEFSPLSSPETPRFGQHFPKHDNPNILKTGKIWQTGNVNVGKIN
ncbi:mitochondrial fission regulator 2 [Narcine bancroftii]|uniref:mitochondrial fission regulator 2 n=1 Tax=Narcine bancroftii TaxID=1343680 RepID=UPI00383220D1